MAWPAERQVESETSRWTSKSLKVGFGSGPAVARTGSSRSGLWGAERQLTAT